ncbi:MAG: hypothetical protein CM15mP117_23460 [Alphaproteobacteria bacterium]|jgi:hypothetical protein|nr:MAG: hypothetical protein CM15mP117_23460 [Alphaproteobacteria bacterium]
MSNIFQKLELAAFRNQITPRTKESREWFMKKAKAMRGISRNELMREEPLSSSGRRIIGSMQMFFYDPKHKETLPYYDRFPLSIILKPAKGGFLGLNLHYLPPILRAQFLDALMDNVTSKKSEDAKFQLTTRLLAGTSELEYYKPCIKHYLTEHVKSKFAEVKAPEWEIATFLPTAMFEKATKQKIYADSRKKIS